MVLFFCLTTLQNWQNCPAALTNHSGFLSIQLGFFRTSRGGANTLLLSAYGIMKKLSMWRMNKKEVVFLARTLLSCCTGRKASGGIAATQHPMATRSSALFRPKWHPAVTAWRSTTSCGRLCVPKPPYMSHCFASDRTVDLRFQRSRTLYILLTAKGLQPRIHSI